MKKNIIKYILLTFASLVLVIIYLSVFGIETEKFNKQIKKKVVQTNSKLDIKLKKIKLTLDPLNFKINAKTINTKIIYQKKLIEFEYIKTQISLISLVKNKFVSSNIEISTKSIPIKDLVSFVRATSNRLELFFLERLIKKGNIILDVEINFDKNGKIKEDYEIRGLLKDGKINLLKNYNFENINFLINVKNDILKFHDISFTTNKINFFSDNLKVTQNKKDFFFTGIVENKNSTLDNELVNLTELNFENINFSSKNNFSFKIDRKYRLKNLVIDSEIHIDEFEYKKPDLFNDYFPKVGDKIHLKDHKIKALYKKDNFSAKGFGKIQLQQEFDEIEYLITNKNKDFNLVSNISLSKLNLKNKKFLRNFFPELNEDIVFKDHKVKIDYSKNNLSFKGSGKIQLEKEFDEINYSISTINNKFNFDTKLNLDKTSLNIDHLNYSKNKKAKTQLTLIGNYEKGKYLNLDKASILEKGNQIILKNLSLDSENKIIKIDEVDLNYFDIENKKNQFLLQRKQKNNYELKGSIFNANSLISDLLKNKEDETFKIFKNNINLNLNLSEVYIDDKNFIKNLKGKLRVKNNKVVQADIAAFFDNNENIIFTINTNDNNEKITTLFSARAKPLVKRYKFIKGYEEGYLDFYSIKKNKISKSTLKIYDFKLQELPALTKLLTLASLQGIADILSGEGIRFNEFEMNFKNKNKIMTIDEIYAIGPAISILMSGYVEYDKLVSLRGSLVPATTINKTISSIPILGKILVGDKIGEGVFGVSFKIKGPPKNLETTVNPIKTLTPRFITRTLEKIKKN
jgi:hypothetical protein